MNSRYINPEYLSEEIWSEVPKFKNYLASNLGRVWNRNHGRYITGSIQEYGYIQICLYRNDKRYFFRLHNLIASLFIEKPTSNEVLEPNHKDGNKLNNKVINLEWLTHSENMIHASNNNLFPDRKGEKSRSHILKETEAREIKTVLNKARIRSRKHTNIIVELAKTYSVSYSAIYDIKRGKSWKHI